jgi:Ser/Thr protein kinase RdoA (MazF antagonist)
MDLMEALMALATLPEWLRAALDPEQVLAVLVTALPRLDVRGVKIRRLLLDPGSGRWAGTYQVTTPAGTTALRGTLNPPGRTGPARPAGDDVPFGGPGWHCHLPALGLDLEPQPAETALAVLPQLTDPERARAIVADALGRPVDACAVDVLIYKPGSRAVLRYDLTYPPGTTGPAVVIAKTYRGAKGRNAHEAMAAMWRSRPAGPDAPALAEPLAWVPELNLLLQGTIPGERTLEDELSSALAGGDPDTAGRQLDATGAALAAMHGSGARHGRTAALADRLGDVRELLGPLAGVVPAPVLVQIGLLLARLEAVAAEHPPGPPVITHGTFSPEQVLLDGERVGFIDFDDACLAEPAMDAGLFLSALPDLAYEAGDRERAEARMDQADAWGERFLTAYEARAPLSRTRVQLWQAADFLVHALQTWTKAKPAGPDKDLLILQRHLRAAQLA